MSVKDADNENQSKMAAKRPSEIYGGEHLLRLFVKLPSLLTSSTMPPVGDELSEFAKFVSEFIVFMQMNRDECFRERYVAVYRGGAR
jgi:mortality factor 4-like protein 1